MCFNDNRVGVLKGDSVIDIALVIRNIPHHGLDDLMNGLIASFPSMRGRIGKAAAGARGLPVAQVKILPLLPKPVNIECMAVNHMENGTRSAPVPVNAGFRPSWTVILSSLNARAWVG
jgi:hypothetical protein